jgi:hypothetical protein
MPFGRRTEEAQKRVSSSPAAMARDESTPARPIVSRSCSGVGQSVASTMECTGMRKMCQLHGSSQAVPRELQCASRAGLEPTQSIDSSIERTTGPHHRIHAGLQELLWIRRSSFTVGVHGPEVEVGSGQLRENNSF